MPELRVVMFTDQVQSTLHTARRTQIEIAQVAEAQDNLTRDVAHQHSGTILKDTGDGLFISFRSCTDAVAGVGPCLQQRVFRRGMTRKRGHPQFELHIGIDLGELLVLPNGDLRGNAANRAARVCAECPPGEVYFTEKVNTELHPREAEVLFDAFRLKGVTGKVNVHRLVKWTRGADIDVQSFRVAGRHHLSRSLFRPRYRAAYSAHVHPRAANCQIVGPRRIGKTSLLRHIERVAPTWAETAVVAYLTCMTPAVPHCLGG